MNAAFPALPSHLPAEFYFAGIAVCLLICAIVLLIQGLIELSKGLPAWLDDFAEHWKLWRAVVRHTRGRRQ